MTNAPALPLLCPHFSQGPRYGNNSFVAVQCLGRGQLFVTLWTAVHQVSLFSTVSWNLLKPMPVKLVMPSNHLILCRPLVLFPSIRVFSSQSPLCIKWPEDWTFSFSISPSNEYSSLISFRMGWFDLLSVQGTLKHLLQHHIWKQLRCP